MQVCFFWHIGILFKSRWDIQNAESEHNTGFMGICHILHHSFTQLLCNYVTCRSFKKQCKCFGLEHQILHNSLAFCIDDGIISFSFRLICIKKATQRRTHHAENFVQKTNMQTWELLTVYLFLEQSDKISAFLFTSFNKINRFYHGRVQISVGFPLFFFIEEQATWLSNSW